MRAGFATQEARSTQCWVIRLAKGTFHAKMGTIKDRNGMDLTEAEEIKKSGKNTQKNYTKKIFTTQITTMVLSLS